MNPHSLRFIRRGQLVSVANVPPERTLLELLREDLGCTAAKEGCNQGDCGACTVVLGERDERSGRLQLRAVNSCIQLAHSVADRVLWTAQDIAPADDHLHPAQEALVRHHGSQCGFCTPGFVMSLFALYHGRADANTPITREAAQHALSGNLCRCTGYRPIVQAAQQMTELPAAGLDEAALLSQLERLERLTPSRTADEEAPPYHAPRTLAQLLAARAARPKAQLVAGCTDVGVWINKQHRRFNQVIDITRVSELRRIERYPHHIAIGAAVTLAEAFDALVHERPQLAGFAHRFAGLPVRNAGTLGGNVANGSPIGDSMPLLIALGASVVLMSVRRHRELPLEALYRGYRQLNLAADEVLAWIKVPRPLHQQPAAGLPPTAGGEPVREFMRVYKVSKRFEDDISAVCLALQIRLQAGRVVQASIGVGGVAATPVRATQAEASLNGQRWNAATAAQAGRALQAQFQPLTDFRASAAYRTQLLAGLMQRFWLESQAADNTASGANTGTPTSTTPSSAARPIQLDGLQALAWESV